MFKICMKNYFANLKYVFVALGVMFIALIIGAQTTVNKTVSEVNKMVTSIEETTETSDLSLERIGDSFTNTWEAIKANVTPEVITGQKQPTKVEESIGESIATVIENYIMYISDIISFIAVCIAGIIVAILLFFVIQILGAFASSTLITMFGRYDIHHDNIFRIILEQLARIVFLSIWLAIVGLICYLNLKIGLVVAAFIPLAFCYIVLFSAWLTAGDSRRPKYGSYVTFVNMLVLLACNILQILISAAIGVIIYFIGGIIVAVVFGVALLILAAANANLNAYAFLYKMPLIQKAIETDTDIVFVESAEQAEVNAAAEPQITIDPVEPVAPAEAVAPAASAVATTPVDSNAPVAPAEAATVAPAEAATAAEAVAPAETAAPAEAAKVEVATVGVNAEEVKPETTEVKAEEPKAKEPKAKEPKVEEPKAEEPKIEVTATKTEETVNIKVEE